MSRTVNYLQYLSMDKKNHKIYIHRELRQLRKKRLENQNSSNPFPKAKFQIEPLKSLRLKSIPSTFKLKS